jgi:VanZ family protein
MTLYQQRKISVISLVLYWPALIVFAHVPVPESVRSAHVSDKGLHFLAYLVLTFLLWFSIKPNEKVSWRKAAAWLLLLFITAYGAADEVVQSFVGRSCDALDILANSSGVIFCLLLLTFLTFVPAALAVSGIVIFGVANIARANLAEVFPIVYAIFNLLAYAIFTLFWLLNMDLLFLKKLSKGRWLALGVGLPTVFLLFVRVSSLLLSRDFTAQDIIIPLAAIMIVCAAGFWKVFSRQGEPA